MSICHRRDRLPIREDRAEEVAVFEEVINRVHAEPGVELYGLQEGCDRLVMTEKCGSEGARSEHLKGAVFADPRSALPGELNSGLDVQVLAPHPGGKPPEGRPVIAFR